MSREWTTKAKELAKDKEIEIEESRWIFGDIKVPKFEKLHPFVSLAETKAFEESNEQELRELVKVKEKSGKIKNLFTDMSSVLHYMSRLKSRLCRIYVIGIDDAKMNLIRTIIQEWLKE